MSKLGRRLVLVALALIAPVGLTGCALIDALLSATPGGTGGGPVAAGPVGPSGSNGFSPAGQTGVSPAGSTGFTPRAQPASNGGNFLPVPQGSSGFVPAQPITPPDGPGPIAQPAARPAPGSVVIDDSRLRAPGSDLEGLRQGRGEIDPSGLA
jgi:hypothetical protein